jgi:hypothetical protein
MVSILITAAAYEAIRATFPDDVIVRTARALG